MGEVVEIGKSSNLKPGDRVIRVGAPARAGLNSGWGGFAETGVATDWRAMQEDGVAGWAGKTVQQILPPDIDPATGTMFITWRETLSYTMRIGIGNGTTVLIWAQAAMVWFCSACAQPGSRSHHGRRGSAAMKRWQPRHDVSDYRDPECWNKVRGTLATGHDVP